jgi:hypothetical protein
MRLFALSVALLLVIAFPAHSQMGAVETSYAGWFGKRGVQLNPENNTLELNVCPGDNSTQYKLIKNRAGEISAVKPFDVKRKSSIRPITVAFSKAEKFGIPVAVAEIRGLPFIARNTVARLEKSENKSFAIAFNSWARCPRIGYFPGPILVLVRPGDEPKLHEWTKGRGGLFRNTEPISLDDPDAAKNLILLDPIEGFELTALSELAKLPFVIAATLDPVPYGPPGLLVNLPTRTLPGPGDDQSGFEARLTELFKSTFPRAKSSDFNISLEKGLRYVANVFGPSDHFISGPDYRGTWLKADILFRFYRSPGETHSIERLTLEIPDGFLPRWPADAKEPPAQDHYRQFHLSPDGKGKTEDLSALNSLQADLGRSFVRKWRGEIID